MEVTEIKSKAPAAEPLHLETKNRVLDTAERMFAERGLEAVSIRDITQAAEVNLGAINYHFGTKQGLIAAVFDRRLQPLNKRRIALLDIVEQKAGNKHPKVDAILEAFIRPAVELGFSTDRGNEHFFRLIGRCLSEPNEETRSMICSRHDELISRFEAAFLRALPELPKAELFWRFKFTFGALQHSLLTCGTEKSLLDLRKQLGAEGIIRRLVNFTAAGWRSALAE